MDAGFSPSRWDLRLRKLLDDAREEAMSIDSACDCPQAHAVEVMFALTEALNMLDVPPGLRRDE